MAENVKRLFAVAATANTGVTPYTVPANAEAVISTLNVCNTGATARTFSLVHVISGESRNDDDYIAKDETILANANRPFSLGIGMQAGDVIVVIASHAEVVFQAWGSELR